MRAWSASVAHGLDFSPTKAISQISGDGLRIPASAFLKAMKRGGTLEKLMGRYTAFSLRYANQTLACNLLHSAEQRICRWLLMCRDRAETEDFVLTHQFLAEMLGIRRQTVTVIAGGCNRQASLPIIGASSVFSIGKGWKPPAANATASLRRTTAGLCSNSPRLSDRERLRPGAWCDLESLLAESSQGVTTSAISARSVRPDGDIDESHLPPAGRPDC